MFQKQHSKHKRPRSTPTEEPEAAASAPPHYPHPGADGSALSVRFKIAARRFTQSALKGKRAAAAAAAATPSPAEPTGPAAALDFICSGGYEAASQPHIDRLQQALDGLSEPQQLNLVPLHALINQPTDWTLNLALQDKVRELVVAAAVGAEIAETPQPVSARGAGELQTLLDAANAEMEKIVGLGLSEDVVHLVQSKADALARELQNRQELDQRAEDFVNEQASCLLEIAQLLEDEIDTLKQVQQHVGFLRMGVRQSMLFQAMSRASRLQGN